jgi:hypothetical protein
MPVLASKTGTCWDVVTYYRRYGVLEKGKCPQGGWGHDWIKRKT